jgi:2'-5' RNA ligase
VSVYYENANNFSFIGLSLDSARFADLFIDLHTHFKDHSLEDAIVFQNPLSLHITLYYLESLTNDAEKAQIVQEALDMSSDGTLKVAQLHLAYFGESGSERVCYLGIQRNTACKKIHEFFAEKYNYTEGSENQLAFVPHISLFRINDPEAYAPHKEAVDRLIHSAIEAIECKDLAKSVHLYQVNSSFQPEIQIPM